MDKPINSIKSSHVLISSSMLISPLTYIHGHWPDLLITKRTSNSIKSVFFGSISDHLAVISEIDGCKTKLNKGKISFQKINKIDYQSFHSDILNSYLGKARHFTTFPQATYQNINFSLDLFCNFIFKY